MMKSVLWVTILISLFVAPIAGQDGGISEAMPPYASRLKTVAATTYVTLSWRDFPDFTGSYVIYRSESPITDATFSDSALIGEVPPGIQTYSDAAPIKTDLYYAVLTKDANNQIYSVLIPYRNVTHRSVSIEGEATIEAQSALVASISAVAQGERIVVTYNSDRRNRDLILYRSTNPLVDREGLLSANLIATLSSSSSRYIDFPVAGVPYYYGILDADMLKLARVEFVPGENSTTAPAVIPLSSSTTGFSAGSELRPRPLPFFLLTSEIDTGDDLKSQGLSTLPELQPLAVSTELVVEQLLQNIDDPADGLLKPAILDADKGDPSRGDAYSLSLILKNEFADEIWEATKTALINFLRVRRSKEIETRAHFYLGQTYYFLGEYRTAFLEFLLAEDEYYSDVKPWMDSYFIEAVK